MIDYILVKNTYRSSVKNVKVIQGEEIASQHCLLSMDMVFKKKVVNCSELPNKGLGRRKM